MNNQTLPKAELHCHLEGTVAPDVALRLAKRHGYDISRIIAPDGRYNWRTFNDFLAVYDVVAEVVRTPEDYYEIFLDYYARAAAQGLIYGEMFISSDHPQAVGISYDTFMETLNQAADDVEAKYGVHVRFVLHVVRHYGIEKARAVADLAEKAPKRRVTGLGIAGDEAQYAHADFTFAFEAGRGAGLQTTAHAGEHAGPSSVKNAVMHLGAQRIGHGVRAAEDADLLTLLKEQNITLEVCPSSNVCLGVAPTIETHQLSALRAAGVPVSLNSDDPPFFFTDIGREYALAQQHHGCTDADLIDITRTALAAAFCDDATRQSCLAHIDAWEKEHLA
ncbi:MAG: adenosine deaminase [Sphingomonadales bacterium]